jgi:hypothetical protein
VKVLGWMESRVSNPFRGPSARFTRHIDLDLRLQDSSGAYVQNYHSSSTSVSKHTRANREADGIR